MILQQHQRQNVLLTLENQEKDFFKIFITMGATKTYLFKAQISEIEPYPLCFGNISKDFRTNNMKKTKQKKKQTKHN